MQTVLDRPTTSTPAVSEADAQRVASEYVISHIDPAFAVVSGFLLARERSQWRFILRSPHGPLGYLRIDAETGAVQALSADELRIIRERALIAEAESRGELPVEAHGYVPTEYARRRANGYLIDQLSLHYSATNGIFVPLSPPVWRFAIQFRLPRLRSAAGQRRGRSEAAQRQDPGHLSLAQLNSTRG